MRDLKAKLIFRLPGKAPVVVKIDDEIVLKRSSATFSIVCEQDIETYDLGIFDSSVSGGKGHARIFWEGDQLFIQDMGSKNGTYLLAGGNQIPLKGWQPKKKRDIFPSEKVPLKKSHDIMLGSLKFRVEIKEKSQSILQQHIHGDFIDKGASKVAIHDSVVQRSNIGADIHVNDDLDGLGEKIGDSISEKVGAQVQETVHKEAEWLDKRSTHRAKVLRKGQLELKGLTEEMSKKMERHFNELMKDMPYPINMEKKKLAILMHYGCYMCGKQTGTIKDRKWTKWLNFAIGGVMAGVGVATLNSEIGMKGVKKLYSDFTQTPLNKIPKDGFTLTAEEKDRMISRLRDNDILKKLHYCPGCNKWVCGKCFDGDAMLCEECSN
ncbi:MAG: FHA domain-containing protein [Candidatus Thermoplasmatota archaeon]|jgi:hypothetical protein|nr:FHA domain-containing protein [Candidatus Thermoplasmatota archaeon]